MVARRARDARGRRDDRGFSLVELLVVLVILPLLLGGITVLVIAVLQSAVPKDPHGVATRFADSHDAQLTAAYLDRDVQGAEYVSTSASPLCAASGTTGNQVLGLEWVSGGSTIDVSYVIIPAPLQLVRYYCSTTGTPAYPVAATSTSIIADNVFSTLSAVTVAAASCPLSGFGAGATTCAASGGVAHLATTVSCFNGSCPSGSLAGQPGLLVHPAATGGVGVASVLIQAQEANSGYQFGIRGSPRGSNASASFANASAGTPAPLIVNGTLSGGNCQISVTGSAAVTSSADGSISDSRNGFISATGAIFTADQSPSGATSGSLGSITPSPVYSSSATMVSPYASLSEPPTAPNGAAYSVVTESASNWDPSTDTTVETSGVLSPATYPHGAIFVVSNGMTISKSFSAPQGVLFYVTGGNVNLDGNGTVDLNALTPNFESPVQPLPEVVVWMSKTDLAGTLTLGGNGAATLVNGAIYAPVAATTLNGGGNSGGLTVDAMDTGPLGCNGQDAVAVVGNQASASASTVTIAPSMGATTVGTPLTASIIVQGGGTSAPTGSVSVYECGPGANIGGCGQTTGWTARTSNQVGSAITSFTSTGMGGGTATSASFTPTAAGTYCFAAYYTGGNYTSSSDTTADGCFTVVANGVAGIEWTSITGPTGSTVSCTGAGTASSACTVQGGGNGSAVSAQIEFVSGAGTPMAYSATQSETVSVGYDSHFNSGNGASGTGPSSLTVAAASNASTGTPASGTTNGSSTATMTATFGSYTAALTVSP